MDRFRWCSTPADGQPSGDETVVTSQIGVTLYNGPGRTHFEQGKITLTSHRLLWQRGTSVMSLPLAAVTNISLQHASGSRSATPKIMLTLLTPAQLMNACRAMPVQPSWLAAWIVDKGDSRVAMTAGLDHVRLGFTQGGHQAFFSALNETLAVSLGLSCLPKMLKV